MSTDAVNDSTLLLLFGDQTDGFHKPIKSLYQQSQSNPLLATFLKDVSRVLRRELSLVEHWMRDSLGGPFSDLLQLAERFRNKEDHFGLAQALLVGIVRAGKLLLFAEASPGIFNVQGSAVNLAGACGGLLVASALVIADDIHSLYQSSLEMIRVTCRLSNMMITRSRSIEESVDSWGWSVIGIDAESLQESLDSFCDANKMQHHRRPKIGASDLDDGWHTVIGPPKVLKEFFTTCTSVKTLPRQKVRVSSLTHALDSLDREEIEYVLGNSNLLEAPLRSRYKVLSLGNMAAYEAPVWRDLLQQVVRDIGTRPLKLGQGLPALSNMLGPTSAISLNVIGPTAHLTIVLSYLEQSGRSVRVFHEPVKSASEYDQSEFAGKVAIVGISGRYPGSDNLEGFWKIIAEGKIMHTEIPSHRFDLDEFYDSKAAKHMSTAAKYGCFISEPGLFDPRFFNISPREALQIDPGHRLFLMSAYEALEMAGYGRGRFAAPDDTRIATFLGQATEDWRDIMHNSGGDAFSLGGLQRSFGPGRLNFHMRWSGPTYSIDSACASGLSSVTMACSSLLAGESDMAVAGGANVIASPLTYHVLSKAGFLSTTGGCKSYRADADGYCRGEFVGAFVLKRLEDAIADNDNILSVIAGSARNHSGTASSITHSDHRAQEQLMAEVLRKARVEPADVSYVEMHGTGTQVGDLSEMTAVTNTFGNAARKDSLKIGAIKANMGHSEAGAGSAALLKSVLMVQTGVIPPQAGLPSALNPKFPNLKKFGIEIPTEPQPFVTSSDMASSTPRSIVINSFDASGGNTCILIQEPPQRRTPDADVGPDPRAQHAITISAKTAKSYTENKRRLLEYLLEYPDTNVANVAYTSTARRLHYPIRSAYTVGSTAELIHRLETDLDGEMPGSQALPPPVVFTFTGQGSSYSGMGNDLFRTSPIFRNKANLCARLAASIGLPPFLDLITDPDTDESTKSAVQTQLAVVTLEVALAAFWTSCGIKPAMVMGHSLGEYAALHIAGVLSLADMLFLVGNRALLIQERCEPGTYSMLAVAADTDTVRRVLQSATPTSCQIACLNSPAATVVSGKIDDIEVLQSCVRAENLRCKILPLAYGFHSSQLDPVIQEYAEFARNVPFQAPTIPVASSLLGEIISSEGVFDGTYLARQAREPVDFVRAVRAVKSSLQNPLWLEIGPTLVCTEMVRATISHDHSSTIVSSLKNGTSNWATITVALCLAYKAGIDIDWAEFHEPYTRHVSLLALPSYAFDTKNYWRVYKSPATSAPTPSNGSSSLAPATTTLQHLLSDSYGPKAEAIFQSFFSDPGLSAVVQGHRLHGVAISPGAVFGDMALTAARYLAQKSRGSTDSVGALNTLRNCVFLRPVVVDGVDEAQSIKLGVTMPSATEGYLEVNATMFNHSNKGARMEYARCTVSEMDSSAVNLQWNKEWPGIRQRCDEVDQAATQGQGHRLSTPLFYALFSQTVDYGESYRRLKGVSVSQNFKEAVAEVEMQAAPAGSSFTMSPYWVDSAVHLAGFLVNCNPSKPANTVAMLHSFGVCNALEPMMAGKPYRVYARVGTSANDSTPVDVWVFHGSCLVLQYSDLRFHQIPTERFMSMLGKKATNTSPAVQRHVSHVVSELSSSRVMSVPNISTSSVMTVPATPRLAPTLSKSARDKGTQNDSRVMTVVLDAIAENTGYESLGLSPKTALADLGIDSIMGIQIAMEIQEKLGVQVEATIFHDHPTIGAVTAAFSRILDDEASDSREESRKEFAPPPTSYTENTLPTPRSHAVSEVAMDSSKIDIMSAILDALATETGTDIADMTDSTALADLGVDSIMAIQVGTAVQDATGIELGATAVHDYPTIGDLRRAFSGTCIQSTVGAKESSKSFKDNGTTEPSDSSMWDHCSDAIVPAPGSPHYTYESSSEFGDSYTTRFDEKAKTPRTAQIQAKASANGDRKKPHVNVVLMHGRLSSNLTPLFMFPDGTGAAATYIYLKRLQNNRPVYAVESPFLHCPEDFTCGAEQAAAMMAEAVIRTQPKGPYLLAGYSGGAILAYEAARQLLIAGHQVQGLLLYDMAAPKIRPDRHEDAMPMVLVEMMVRLMGGSRNVWLDQAAARKSQMHMRNTVRCVSTYDAKPMPHDRRPAHTIITWCKRGVAERLDDQFKQKLAANGISCEPVANFMEDPEVGPFNWTFPPNKPLRPNGWEKMVGPVRCMAIDADHFSMIVPPAAGQFQRALEEALASCTSA